MLDPFINALNALPAGIRPLAAPAAGVVITFMGIMAIFSMGNQGLRAAIKEHFVWIIFGAILVFSGVALVTNFFGMLGG